jgi:hypothetical protein
MILIIYVAGDFSESGKSQIDLKSLEC